jgi:F0F1-type ATP synthase assembly protein I
MGTSNPANQWMALLNLGWLIVMNLAVFVIGGIFLDKRLGTAPIFILVGTGLAFAGCGLTVYKTVQKLNRDETAPPGTPDLKHQD